MDGLLYKIGFTNEIFNGMTGPGWVTALIWVLFWILSTQLFKEVPIQPQAESYELSQTIQWRMNLNYQQ